MPFKPDLDSVVPTGAQKEVFLEMAAALRVSHWEEENLVEYAVSGVMDELRNMSEEELDTFVAETLELKIGGTNGDMDSS